jgi:hypothetical protein
MAQNQFINVTLGANATNVEPGRDQGHRGSPGASASSDLTVSWDSAKFTTLDLLQKGVATAMKIAAGQFK